MPRLIRLYILQVLVGFGLSAVFVAALLWFDVGGLWRLVSGSDAGLLAVTMLWVFNGIVFAAVQFGIAVMRMGASAGGGGGGTRRPVVTPDRNPVPVRAEALPRRAAPNGQGPRRKARTP